MFRALWFLMKIALLVAAASWLALRPGRVRIEWLDYVMHVEMGALLVLAL